MKKEHLNSPWLAASVAIVAVVIVYSFALNSGVVEAEDGYHCPIDSEMAPHE